MTGRTLGSIFSLGKQNHLASYKREHIRKNAPPLIIPESNAEIKKKRRKKVTSLADGPPGDTRLAPPLLSVNLDRQEVQPEPTIRAQDDEEDDPSHKIDLPIPSVLSSFLVPLDAFIEVDDLENAMTAFEKLMDGITTAVQEHFHLPLQSTDPSKKRAGKSRKNFDPMNAQEVQKLYKWNRRRCVRSIACPTSNRCTITKEALSAHFTNTWGAPNEEFILHGNKIQDRPPILESLDPEFVFSCLQSSENSAPGADQISYRQWREVDPRCLALSKIFNICLKLKDVPRAWKVSNCILIHKKGDQNMIENWRPIALSNKIYKLFMKYLTRKMQDWCSMNQVLSSAQKGFTPHDGVIEHNFLLAQHIENATRRKNKSLIAFLDISNAFGSIPNEVIFQAMEREGVDPEFPLQGCPLSGLLFNLAINHILVNIQGEQESHKILAFADDLVLLSHSILPLCSILFVLPADPLTQAPAKSLLLGLSAILRWVESLSWPLNTKTVLWELIFPSPDRV
ncbi:retrovirus-related Pol polyprotein from type-1 retrotransposable element R2 [Nephila pilipes]|uniref:Retrovirus-related Pol polyprotein from type-1 retrotransposable element R2 n=1 Tax=Nephila pilipes TaxID=299642 RepID=A0A8X6PFN7_NEPPI|nr:retrovirus-related Pol polyprotein from type-1 retrotransposable element R2 [Nephila pilipes]